jgi:hypothetical protein
MQFLGRQRGRRPEEPSRPGTAKLLVQGVEIKEAQQPFSGANAVAYPKGSFLVPMAQPKMGLVRYLLGRTFCVSG